MTLTKKLTLFLLAISLSQSLNGQVIDTNLIQGIISTVKQEEAFTILKTLTDSIGGRITGTQQSKETAAFILKKLKGFGLDNAHLEDYELKTRWNHNSATGRIISPTNQSLVVGSYGWCPGTNGEINIGVVDLGSFKDKEIPAFIEDIKGVAVIVDPTAKENMPQQVIREQLAEVLAKSGAAAMLIPSDKSNRLLYSSAFGFYPLAPLPIISIAKEDALLLRRIFEHHPAKITLNINNTIINTPSTEFNVVADIPGTDTSGTILLGAHFDSWDYGQGAQDNGSGVAAIMEVARIFKLLHIQPQHTIRFAFFSGEEQGLLGSHAYVIKHEKELNKLKSVIIMDNGAEAPKGFYINGRADMESMLRNEFQILSPLGASDISPDPSFDTDHGPFLAAGIPALILWVNEGDYDLQHHSMIDTYDKVNPDLLAADAAVLAIATYALDNSLKNHYRLSRKETELLMKRTGLESMQMMLLKGWDHK